MTDRDIDGRYDCTADRPGYVFADFWDEGNSGAPLHDDDDCSTGALPRNQADGDHPGCHFSVF
jgi:hypothetical protein